MSNKKMRDVEKLKEVEAQLNTLNVSPSRHRFWNTQPVISEKDISTKSCEVAGPIKTKQEIGKIMKTPLKLPEGFYWSTFDISNDEHLEEFYNLLETHYVEDDDHFFRFRYSKEFLTWALTPPGFSKDWHICVRSRAKNEMLATITAIPVTIIVGGIEKKMVEINFLCIQKRFRSKRMSPVLIKEITRRVNHSGIFQAIYTAGIKITVPFSENIYHHRQLNPKKLVEVGFASKHPTLKMESINRIMALYPDLTIPNLVKMEEKHVASAKTLLNEYLKKFKIKALFSLEEFEHWFLPKDGIVESYVVESDGKVTDFLSYYELSSAVLKCEKHKELFAAYAFYNVATSVSLDELIQNALVIAKKKGFDVFNALEIMDNRQFLRSTKFRKGDGTLNYYMFNWKFSPIKPSENSVILF